MSLCTLFLSYVLILCVNVAKMLAEQQNKNQACTFFLYNGAVLFIKKVFASCYVITSKSKLK